MRLQLYLNENCAKIFCVLQCYIRIVSWRKEIMGVLSLDDLEYLGYARF